jgi:hypothetical protein
MSGTPHPLREASPSAGPLRRRGFWHRIPVDLALGVALLLLAVVGGALRDPTDVREARPFVGTWRSTGGPPPHTLVVEQEHRASIDGVPATWRIVRPTPARIPPPPTLVLDFADGRTVQLHLQGESLLSREGTADTPWERAPSPP